LRIDTRFRARVCVRKSLKNFPWKPPNANYSKSPTALLFLGRPRFTDVSPLIGAAIFVVLQDYLSSQTENWMSFVGLFFVLVVLFFPRGILGAIRRKVAS
jgi:ABC-type branched-subunit amino acid transport system permease subunit